VNVIRNNLKASRQSHQVWLIRKDNP